MSALRTAVLAHFRAGSPGPALTVESGTYSYDVLGHVATNTADHIRSELGSGGVLRVAVLSSGTLTAYVALLAAFELDATYVPLDPAAPVERLRDALIRSHADMVVIDQRHPDLMTELGQEWPLFDPADGVWCGSERRPAAVTADADGSPDDRYVLFTSGSTGVPKGIGITDRCIEAMFGAMAEIAPVKTRDIVAQTFDLTFATTCDPVESDLVDAAATPLERAHRISSFTLVRTMLATASGVAPVDLEIDRTCARCGAAHGRPRARGLDLDVSVSHAGDWVVACVGRWCRVGVDAEPGDRRRWTAVEAVMKCDGIGLRVDHTEVAVTTDPLRLTRYPSRPGLVERIRLHALNSAPPGITATLAALPSDSLLR